MLDHKRYRDIVNENNARWGVLDEELYDLCRRRPTHDELRNVVAKVALIGRGYATRIESVVPKGNRNGAGSAIWQVAEVLHSHVGELDCLIGELQTIDIMEPTSLESVVVAHGTVTSWIRDAFGGDAPKSFVSKYLHFHTRSVPIYDSYTERALKEYRAAVLKEPPFAYVVETMYRSYWEHCLAFIAAYKEAYAALGVKPLVKDFDAYLLNV